MLHPWVGLCRGSVRPTPPVEEAVMVKPVETFPPRGRDDASWRIKLYKLRLESADEPSNAEGAPELRPRHWK